MEAVIGRWDAVEGVVLRSATAADAAAVLALVTDHREEGHLLSRTFDEIAKVVHRFVVADCAGEIVGCAELAPLGPALAEVRSLVVSQAARSEGVGRRLVAELIVRAEAAGYEQLCAFTHGPAWFCRLGFSIVPHVWLMPKLLTDCVHCPLFRRCGQYAVVVAVRAGESGRAVPTVPAA
jgi:N-acetylglutamate synthase-like GNAT family acetyltransferase